MTSLRPVRGTRDIVGEDALRHRKVIETGREVAARYGYAEVATPIFEFTEVCPHARRDLGRGHQGDVQLHRSRRRDGDLAPRIHRRRRARVHLRIARPEPADQAVLLRPDVPLRAAAEGAPAPVPPDRRRGDRRAGAARRRRGDRARRPDSSRAGPSGQRHPRAQHARRSRQPARLSRPPGRIPFRAIATGCRPTASSASSATPCASWTARMPAIARS